MPKEMLNVDANLSCITKAGERPSEEKIPP